MAATRRIQSLIVANGTPKGSAPSASQFLEAIWIKSSWLVCPIPQSANRGLR